MELLQCHKVCEIVGDELHRPPVVGVSGHMVPGVGGGGVGGVAVGGG